MITNQNIRRARIERGWSQRELAQHLGVSQSWVSMLEAGHASVNPALEARLRTLLSLEPPRTETPSPVLRGWTTPVPTIPGLSFSQWRRPDVSGDSFLVVPFGPGTTLIAALDVAGHGPFALAGSVYAQGWLRGIARAGVPPRLAFLVAELQAEAFAVGLDCAWFLALIAESTGGTIYEAASSAYPAPLLLVGDPLAPQPSSIDAGLPAPGRAREYLHAKIAGPWRLVMASDGLLKRLGSGNEEHGKRALLRWQTDARRDMPPHALLRTTAELADDESCAVLTAVRWDREPVLAGSGRGGSIVEDGGYRLMRDRADHVDTRRAYPAGTVVTLTFRRR